jgi:transcriptional regulator with XRE-family HTH domain
MSSPANRIASCREASGLKRIDVAAQLRVGEVTVARWETGKSGIPDHHKLSLSELFGVSVPWLMGWTDGANGNGDGARQVA